MSAALAEKRGPLLNRVSLSVAVLLLVASSSLAQTGGSYDLTWNTIDGGGATFSTGGSYRVGGTVGQPDAGLSSAGAFVLNGGFWGGIGAVATPTATVTSTVPPTHTASATASPTMPDTTPTPSVTATAATGTPSGSPTASQTASATATAPPPTTSPTPTPTPPACTGDCNHDDTVTVDELIKGVNIALGTASVDTCLDMDANGDGAVTINELIAAVNRALNGCATAES